MKLLHRFMTGLLAAPFVWAVASWADVLAHNTSDYSYAWWNLFTIIF